MSSPRQDTLSLATRLRGFSKSGSGASWLRRCDRVGQGAMLDGRPHVENRGWLSIGEGFHLASRPVQSHLVAERAALLEIGDGVFIGHGAAIAAHRQVRIGDGVRVGPFVVISDTDFHSVGRPDARPRIAPVLIGRDVRIGSRVTILRGAIVGDGAHVVAGSVVSGVVPSGVRVGGVPARPIEAEVGTHPDVELGEELDVLVPRVVAKTLGLASAPELASEAADIPSLDSLGVLNLMLAIEEAFGVSVDEEDMPHVRRVEDLVRIVEAARERRPRSR